VSTSAEGFGYIAG